MGMLKTTYQWAAGLALIHAALLIGGVGYFFGTGEVDVPTVRKAIGVLASDESTEDLEEGTTEDTGPVAEAKIAVSAPEIMGVRDEIARRNTERYRTQVEQRLKLLHAARVDVDRRREEFERLQTQKRAEEQNRLEEEAAAGFNQQVRIISALAPKAALRQVVSMSDTDAAQILFKLSTRKAKKIIEAAKSEEELAKVTAVLSLVRDMKGENGTEGQTP